MRNWRTKLWKLIRNYEQSIKSSLSDTWMESRSTIIPPSNHRLWESLTLAWRPPALRRLRQREVRVSRVFKDWNNIYLCPVLFGLSEREYRCLHRISRIATFLVCLWKGNVGDDKEKTRNGENLRHCFVYFQDCIDSILSSKIDTGKQEFSKTTECLHISLMKRSMHITDRSEINWSYKSSHKYYYYYQKNLIIVGASYTKLYTSMVHTQWYTSVTDLISQLSTWKVYKIQRSHPSKWTRVKPLQ